VPASVPEARRLVRDLLRSVGRDDLEDVAALLVSEIVTNALLHAGTPINVAARLEDRRLRVEVRDGSVHLPVPRRYASTAGTGRGLLMVEQLVDDWGVLRHADGKTVWFVLSDAERAHKVPGSFTGVDDGSGDASDAAGTVAVELLSMPLLLHKAWQEHVEALLRELLLASLDEEDLEDFDSIAMHAEATDALAVLAEHVPAVDLGPDPDQLMRDMTEPGVSSPRVVVPVPRDSVPNFDTLERAVVAALELSKDGGTLTPPTQPEIQQFRAWLCQQVRQQASGLAPEPWSVDDSTPAPSGLAPSWDPVVVSAATTGRVAADESNRIIAVSPVAAELLGYADPWDLVGLRLLAMIPERYHQAHVAGFTLMHLTGRSPLLDVPVTVPARRADGSEVLVTLLVRVERGEDGRPVFVAELGPAAD
jgi:PAS domain S-box-containing protein